MRIFAAYLKPHWKLITLSLLLAGLAQVLNLVDPLIFGRIVDEYVVNANAKPEGELVRGAIGWLLLAAAIAAAARLAKALQDYVLRIVVQSSGREIFNDGLKQTLRLSFAEFADRSSGEAVAVLQKVRTDTERFLNGVVNVLFTSLVGVSFLIWFGIRRSWILVPIFTLGVVLLAVISGLLSRRIKSIQKAIVRETSKMAGQITESLRNVELIKSLGLTYSETKRLKGYTQRIYDLELDKVKRVRSLAFLQGTAINLLRHSILFMLLWLIFRHTLTAGELISMQFLIATIFAPLQELGNIILNYREAEASLANFGELMALPIEQHPEDPIDIGLLEELRFDDVVFRHSGCEG